MAEEKQGEQTPRLEEAERMLDSLVDRVRGFTRRTAALAREEVEDMVEEARDLRRPRQG
jgi:hypothetical protein